MIKNSINWIKTHGVASFFIGIFVLLLVQNIGRSRAVYNIGGAAPGEVMELLAG